MGESVSMCETCKTGSSFDIALLVLKFTLNEEFPIDWLKCNCKFTVKVRLQVRVTTNGYQDPWITPKKRVQDEAMDIK